MSLLTRRSFFVGVGAALAAPAIVRVQNIMPVRALALDDAFGALIQIRPVLTMARMRQIIEHMRAIDQAREAFERACGVPEGYRLLYVINAARSAPSGPGRA